MSIFSVRFLSAALMALIFVCGFLSGRLTAPRGGGAIEPTITEPPAVSGNAATRRVITRYREDLNLSDEQLRELEPLFEAAGERMSVLPKNSAARLRELERFHEQMNPHLTGEQQERARGILEEALAKRRDRSKP
jgi:hypothetical protein